MNLSQLNLRSVHPPPPPKKNLFSSLSLKPFLAKFTFTPYPSLEHGEFVEQPANKKTVNIFSNVFSLSLSLSSVKQKKPQQFGNYKKESLASCWACLSRELAETLNVTAAKSLTNCWPFICYFFT